MYKHILVPVDGSSGDDQALKHARQLASATDADLTLLAVVPNHGWAHVPRVSELDEQERRLAEEYLNRKVAELEAEGLRVSSRIESGAVAAAIESMTEYEVHYDIDLIVMSTHGAADPVRSGVGGTALQVLMHSNEAPVLMVRRED